MVSVLYARGVRNLVVRLSGTMSVATECARESHNSGRVTPRNEVVMLFQSTLPQRFWDKVYADEYGCWLWTGATNRQSYGQFCIRLTTGAWRQKRAHRLAYIDLRGDIPGHLQIDHLCRIRPCVNPWHLEPVTSRENSRRGVGWNGDKAHCTRGHPYCESNTYTDARGSRHCRTCEAARKRAYYRGGVEG